MRPPRPAFGLIWIPVTLLLYSLSVTGQSAPGLDIYQLKANVLFPGLGFEKALGIRQSIFGEASLLPGLQITERIFDFHIFPGVEGQYRYYISMKRRAARGRRVAGNSADYLTASATLYFGKIIDIKQATTGSYFGIAGPSYGIQRTMENGFYMRTEFGVGYYFYDNIKGAVLPVVKVRLGWVISSKLRSQ